ncbi:MAG: sugar phosphorylase, partial [Lentisphaeria bacterium]
MYFFQQDMLFRTFERHLERLYGKDQSKRCLERLNIFLSRYDTPLNVPDEDHSRWSQRDVVLITYGDMAREENEKPIRTLKKFCDNYLRGCFNNVHILPFFPYSSDDGFSVIDYREVDPELGDWQDIENFAADYKLGVDLVLNHVSRQSSWFSDYVAGIMPYSDYFIEVSPEEDLSRVVRPRSGPLLTEAPARNGYKHLWTTFSEDQIDLDFSNPDVFFDFLDILLTYLEHGARIVRLDAIAYLWKKPGTNCIHLPETHEVVKLFRRIIDILAPGTIILTETNVPQDENLSYFGNSDEAHMVYQFPLPPLLLHALLEETSEYLNKWVRTVSEAPEGCTFLNFTASHDGVGIRPLEGLVPEEQIMKLCETMKQKGGYVSTRKKSDGSDSPYELNITYYNALAEADDTEGWTSIHRFLCSQFIALALKGIPAVYFNSLCAALNDNDAVKESGKARSVNRHKWRYNELSGQLEAAEARPGFVFSRLRSAIKERISHPAFHPDAEQRVIQFNDGVFAVERTAPWASETVLAVSNVTGRKIKLDLTGWDKWDLLSGDYEIYNASSAEKSSSHTKNIEVAGFHT